MQLHQRQAEIASHNVALHLIGTGSPHFIEGFRELTGYKGGIYTDPSRKVFKVAGLTRGVFASLGPQSVWQGMKSVGAGYRQGRRQGDAWQQGGALVISKESELIWSHRSQFGGDNVSVDALIESLE